MGKNLIDGNKKQAKVMKQEIITYGYEVMIKKWGVEFIDCSWINSRNMVL